MPVPSEDHPLPSSWDLESDVVVVGGGNAGLPAAIEARQAGAEVLMIESNGFLGGLMRGSGGFMSFCDTHVQRRNGIEDRLEWGYAYEMAMSDDRAVPEIVRTYVAGGAETCRWLEELGLTWSDRLRGGGGEGPPGLPSVPRVHFAGLSATGLYPGGGADGQCGYALTVVLEEAVAELGIPVLLRHRMRRIHRVPDGPVLGISAETPDDGTVRVRARRAVVLAAGGYTSNEALVKAWDPRLVNDAVYSDGLPYMASMGDALIAGQEVGGQLSDMSFVCFTPVKYGTHWYSLSVSAISGQPGIARSTGVSIPADGYRRIVLVAGDGRRYVDESLAAAPDPRFPRDSRGIPAGEYPEESFFRRFFALPNPKNVWAVTDSLGADAMGWPLDELRDPQPMCGHGLHPDSVAHAGSLERLADLMRMPGSAFATTIGSYNAAAATGRDDEYGRPPPFDPIAVPPFYAAKLNVIRHTPAGGLRVNTRGQVLDRSGLWDRRAAVPIDEEPTIPRLYAAGECTAFVGFRRSHRKTGPIIVMARIAGRCAAAERPG